MENRLANEMENRGVVFEPGGHDHASLVVATMHQVGLLGVCMI